MLPTFYKNLKTSRICWTRGILLICPCSFFLSFFFATFNLGILGHWVVEFLTGHHRWFVCFIGGGKQDAAFTNAHKRSHQSHISGHRCLAKTTGVVAKRWNGETSNVRFSPISPIFWRKWIPNLTGNIFFKLGLVKNPAPTWTFKGVPSLNPKGMVNFSTLKRNHVRHPDLKVLVVFFFLCFLVFGKLLNVWVISDYQFRSCCNAASCSRHQFFFRSTPSVGCFMCRVLLGGGFKCFYFHPYLGKIPNLTNIFQRGWNHQLVYYSFYQGLCEWIPGITYQPIHSLSKMSTTMEHQPLGNTSIKLVDF